jgi:MFS family permease
MGWWSMTTAAAPALGLIVGGPLVDWLGWRTVFLVQALFSMLALALAWVVLRETPRKRVRFDVAGAFALAIGVGGFMAALGGIPKFGVGSSWIWLCAAIGVVGIAAFVRVEGRVRDPLLPLALFRLRSFSATLATNAFNSAAYMGAFVMAPLLLYRSFDFSITEASLLMLLRTASLTLFSPVGGILGERFGERGGAAFGCGLMTLALGLVAWGASESNLVAFGIGLVGQGAGHGLSQPSVASAIARSVDESDLGVATAANRLAGQGGASFGIAALTIVYAGIAEPDSFARAFALAVVLCAVSTLTALAMGGRSPVRDAFTQAKAVGSS